MYGVCASGISMDRVADDRGILGWSQWRYVVKVWCSGSGTSGSTIKRV